MIKYSFYGNNYYFVIPDIKEDWCILLIKTETISTFINLWKDRLNNNDGLNYTFYKPDYRDVESIKTFFDSAKDKKKITLVSFTKDDVDYHNEPSEIVEDLAYIEVTLESFKFHRNKISGAYATPMISEEILERKSNQNTYPLPATFNKNMNNQGIPFGALSKSLGFDTEAFIKPKNLTDVRMLLDEGIRIMDELNNSFDELVGWKCREDFCVGDKRFTQYIDKNDDAHILMLDPSIKKQMVDEQRTNLNPWVEVFFIDGNYCHFKNKHGNIVGRINLKSCDPMKWEFIVYDGNQNNKEKRLVFECKRSTPYDCEREVIKWMIENNLFDKLVNFE